MGCTRNLIRRCAAAALTLALLSLLAAASAAASDSRAGAERLFYGYPIEQDISGFATEAGEPATLPNSRQCEVNGVPESTVMLRTAWYRVIGTGGKITLTTAGSVLGTGKLDTVLAVYELGGSTPLKCSDDVSATDQTSRIASLPTATGKTYEVQVGANDEFCFGCELHLSATNDQTPAGDQRAAPLALTSVTAANNGFASEEPGEPLSCTDAEKTAAYSKTLWFSYNAPDYGRATFETEGLNTGLAVFPGASSSPLACNNDKDYPAHETNSRLGVDVTPGQEYLVQVGGFTQQGVTPVNGAFSTSVSFVVNEDVDGDGAKATRFGGGDCNDLDPAIHPGATEVLGNAVDENCDGVAAPYPRLDVKIAAHFELEGKLTRITKLKVARAPAGSTVKLTCTKKSAGCSFSKKTYAVKATKTLKLTKAVKGLRLKAGAKLDVRVTAPQAIGADKLFTMRSGKLPKVKALCLVPGVKAPTGCS